MSQRLAIDLTGDLTEFERQPSSRSTSLMNTSADLTTRARAGDHEAFRLIFERYARPVLSFIYDFVGDRELAEDLTQETFVRAYKSLRQIRDDAKLSSWLFGIARNVVRESLRFQRKQNENLLDDQVSACEVEDTTQTTPAQCLLNKEINGAMHDALQALTHDWRLIFILKVFHERSYQEISEITGFSVGKVKTDLHRARLEMKRRMHGLF